MIFVFDQIFGTGRMQEVKPTFQNIRELQCTEHYWVENM